VPKIEMSGHWIKKSSNFWIKNICAIWDKYLLEEEKD